MLDFSPVRERRQSIQELADPLSTDDLRNLTNESIDMMLASIEGCTDADVVFVPHDPDAHDAAAADEADLNLAWTLGHVIVHATASGEEYGVTGMNLARGVPFQGRPRYEIPWQEVTTIAQCRDRLTESRRMRLAILDVFPDEPHLDNTYQPNPNADPINAKAAFLRGLSHDDAHQEQIREIVRQAKTARGAA